MIYNAHFDFRNPQEQPEEDGGHQFTLKGTVAITSEIIIIQMDDYNIEARKNSFGAFEGEDTNNNVKASWVQITKKQYVGQWDEDGTEYLFSIETGKEKDNDKYKKENQKEPKELFTISLDDLKKSFSNCSKSVIYIGNIPKKKKDNILKTYGRGINEKEEKILMIVDATFWGSAKKGITLTDKQIYWANSTSREGWGNIFQEYIYSVQIITENDTKLIEINNENIIDITIITNEIIEKVGSFLKEVIDKKNQDEIKTNEDSKVDVKTILLQKLKEITDDKYYNFEEYLEWDKTLYSHGFIDDKGLIKKERQQEYEKIISHHIHEILTHLLEKDEIAPHGLLNLDEESALQDFTMSSQLVKGIIGCWWEENQKKTKKKTTKTKPAIEVQKEKNKASSKEKTEINKEVIKDKANQIEKTLKGKKAEIVKLLHDNTPTLFFIALFGMGFKNNFPFNCDVLAQYLKDNPGKIATVANAIASLSSNNNKKLSASEWMGSMSLGWMIATFGGWYKQYTKSNISRAFKEGKRVHIEFANSISRRKSPLYVSYDGKTAHLVEYVGHHSGDTVKISELNIISTDIIKKAKGKEQSIPVKEGWGEFQNKNKMIEIGEIINPNIKVEVG